jgi:cyanophycinase
MIRVRGRQAGGRRGALGSAWLACALVAALSAGASAGQRLVVIGGGHRPDGAMARFVEWAGGERARILVISWATESPEVSFESFKEQVEPLGPGSVEPAPFAPLSADERASFLAQLERATGVFFTGGDQVRIMNVLADASLADALRARYAAGVVFGGTSAGAAIMSPTMITGNGDFRVIDAAKVETMPGLGLLPGTIVDQHFIARQRQNRLFGLVLRQPEALGVGVDEGTALLVVDDRYGEVVGESFVMIVDARARKGALVLNLLEPGAKYDLRKRRVVRSR